MKFGDFAFIWQHFLTNFSYWGDWAFCGYSPVSWKFVPKMETHSALRQRSRIGQFLQLLLELKILSNSRETQHLIQCYLDQNIWVGCWSNSVLKPLITSSALVKRDFPELYSLSKHPFNSLETFFSVVFLFHFHTSSSSIFSEISSPLLLLLLLLFLVFSSTVSTPPPTPVLIRQLTQGFSFPAKAAFGWFGW